MDQPSVVRHRDRLASAVEESSAALPYGSVQEDIENSLGSWTRRVWTPEADHPLASVVRAIIHWDGRATLPCERLFPDTTVELVVHLGAPHRLITPGGRLTLPPACISGIHSSPATIEAPAARTCTLCIRLHPTGAYALLAQPLVSLRDRTVDLHDCIGRAAGALVAACEGARTPVDRIQRAVAWLVGRISCAPAAERAILWAAAEIERHSGAVPVAALRKRAGLSAARFVAAFREQVGVTPKRYARIARFRCALGLLHQRQEAISLSNTALAAGYYDQAHMNGEFRTFGALTPGEFVSAVRAPQWVGMAESMH